MPLDGSQFEKMSNKSEKQKALMCLVLEHFGLEFDESLLFNQDPSHENGLKRNRCLHTSVKGRSPKHKTSDSF
jgi:hypothetical protein